jgi:hypothetical protein
VSTYFTTKARVSRENKRDLKLLREEMKKLEDKRLPTLSDERVREIVEHALKDYLTVEEFTAYTNLDSDRRERLIDKIGELKGTVAALLQRR